MVDTESEYEDKKEILEEIMLKEEDVLAQLKRLVKLAKPFLRVDENTGRVVLSENFSFTHGEELFLAFVGKYFARHYGILEEEVVGIGNLSDDIGVPVTSLSGPLGRLVADQSVDKLGPSKYRVNPHKIEATLQELTRKYLTQHEER